MSNCLTAGVHWRLSTLSGLAPSSNTPSDPVVPGSRDVKRLQMRGGRRTAMVDESTRERKKTVRSGVTLAQATLYLHLAHRHCGSHWPDVLQAAGR